LRQRHFWQAVKDCRYPHETLHIKVGVAVRLFNLNVVLSFAVYEDGCRMFRRCTYGVYNITIQY